MQSWPYRRVEYGSGALLLTRILVPWARLLTDRGANVAPQAMSAAPKGPSVSSRRCQPADGVGREITATPKGLTFSSAPSGPGRDFGLRFRGFHPRLLTVCPSGAQTPSGPTMLPQSGGQMSNSHKIRVRSRAALPPSSLQFSPQLPSEECATSTAAPLPHSKFEGTNRNEQTGNLYEKKHRRGERGGNPRARQRASEKRKTVKSTGEADDGKTDG